MNTTTQLPHNHIPGFLPGASSLIEQLDKRILLILRDSRHITGILRSFDQFSNFILEDAKEREMLYSEGVWREEDVGVVVVRGDNVVLLGEYDEDEDDCSEEDEKDEIKDGNGNSEGLMKTASEDKNSSSNSKSSDKSKMRKIKSSKEWDEISKRVDKEKEKKMTVCWDFDLDLQS